MVEIRKVDHLDPRDEQVAQLQSEVQGLAALVARVLASGDAHSAKSQAEAEAKAEKLEPVEEERARFQAAWAAEPKVQIMIAPDQNDRNARDSLQARLPGVKVDYPPHTFQVNGVQLNLEIGKLITVPESIAALYAHTLDPWSARGMTPPVTFDQAESRLGLAA